MGTAIHIQLIKGERLDQRQINERKLVTAHTMTNAQYASMKEYVESRTCEGHTSNIVEDAARNQVMIEWCCNRHG